MSFDPLSLAIPGVRSLSPYQPGKDIGEIQRELGLSDVIKLASNENPRLAKLDVWNSVQDIIPTISRYPDGGGQQLKIQIAKKLNVHSSQITLGNGSNDVLEMVGKCFVQNWNKIIISQHAFVVYALIAASLNAKLSVVPSINWGHDLKGMQDSIDQDTRVIFIANPNNPTGTWVSKNDLESFLVSVPEHVLVVLDEAYFEYVQEESYPNGVDLLEHYPNLIITRTFSKIYGLAGLRVGYSVSSPEIAEILNRIRQPFNVNSFGYAAAIAVLENDTFVRESCELNQREMVKITKELKRLNLSWIPSVANFLAIDLQRPADPIVQHMLQNGVIVRPIGNYDMPNFIRVTVGLERENRRALKALEFAIKDIPF
tara:strand:+ start:1757 stop:2869 length:1113 start_codon:yes stop_codon:yes gene_type:complete